MSDGQPLACVVHEPVVVSKDVVLIYLHGIESHAAWFQRAAGMLAGRGYPVYCLDRRGSGINRENRGCISGHVPRGVDLLEDLHAVIGQIRMKTQAKAVFLIGLSWGGKYALAYDMAHPGMLAGLVLITPGIKPKVGYALRDKLAVLIDMAFAPQRRFRIPITAEMFTQAPEFLDFIRNDELRLHEVSASLLWQSHRMDQLLARRRTEKGAPMLVFLAGHDRIIDNDATRRFLHECSTREIAVIEYSDQTHSIQLDAPERLVHDIAAWLAERTSTC